MHAQPEMEMVARGLKNHLKVDQREFLMNTFKGICGESSSRSVAEALGLVCQMFVYFFFPFFFYCSIYERNRFCYLNNALNSQLKDC